jgi:hypothetical protein
MGRKHRRKKKTTPEAPATPAGPSGRYRFFVWMMGFFGLAALLLLTDQITPWPGAEAWQVWRALPGTPDTNVLATLLSGLPVEGENWLVFRRLPSVLFILLTVVAILALGHRLFRREILELSLLAAIGSLFLPLYGKIATLDAPILFLHVGLWLSAVRWMKMGYRKTWWLALFLAGGLLFAPLSTTVLTLGLAAFAEWQKSAYRLRGIGGATLVVGLALSYLSPAVAPSSSYWFFSNPETVLGDYSRLLGYSLLGCLPFIGFTLAGLRDLPFLARRGEEQAQLLAATLLVSWLAQSLLFTVVLLLLTGRQLVNYFKPNYPWRDWVRGGATLHLIFAAIGAILVLLGGFVQFQGAGFRAALGMVAAYWIFSLFGVIGLYGNRRDWSLGGTLLAGTLAVLFFWTQVYPYIEPDRNWPEELAQKMRQAELPAGTIINIPGAAATELERVGSAAAPDLQRAGYAVQPGDADDSAYYQLRAQLSIDSTGAAADRLSVSGRSVLKRYDFYLVPPSGDESRVDQDQ